VTRVECILEVEREPNTAHQGFRRQNSIASHSRQRSLRRHGTLREEGDLVRWGCCTMLLPHVTFSILAHRTVLPTALFSRLDTSAINDIG